VVIGVPPGPTEVGTTAHVFGESGEERDCLLQEFEPYIKDGAPFYARGLRAESSQT